jgi:hypothetical protein
MGGESNLFGWDATNKVWRKLQVDDEGKIITTMGDIFENPPTDGEEEKGPSSNWAYDHDADPDRHHIRYTDAEAVAAVGYNGTKYFSCPGNDFRVHRVYYADPGTLLEGYTLCRENNMYYVCPVYLPHGAVVTNVIVHGNAATEDVNWYLKRIRVSDLTPVTMASAKFNTADNTITSGTIDNSLYAYFFYTDVMSVDDQIWGGIITYTI